jgi:phosphopantothenoylcysteine decarboxylase/phosphopantothenate--cysteine ligase
MHTEMWENNATQANVSLLRLRGINIVWPEVGRLTGEDTGIGRLAEPQQIFEEATSFLGGPLSGKRVLVTAGGTREPIDVARFIGNYSSGKQGIAFARVAKQLGAEVQVIGANVDESMTVGLDCVKVQTASELGQALKAKQGSYDVLIMSAAVADFSPAEPTGSKLKRSEIGDKMELQLVANPDLLAQTVSALGVHRQNTIVVGFAAEASGELESLAREKLESKNCDYIVANDVSNDMVFGKDDTEVLLVSQSGSERISGSKQAVAATVLSRIASNAGES